MKFRKKMATDRELSAHEMANELVMALQEHDTTVQNEVIEYLIKGITATRVKRIQELEMEAIRLRDTNHDLTTRLAYINHNRSNS